VIEIHQELGEIFNNNSDQQRYGTVRGKMGAAQKACKNYLVEDTLIFYRFANNHTQFSKVS
jgi:hypothetical protein